MRGCNIGVYGRRSQAFSGALSLASAKRFSEPRLVSWGRAAVVWRPGDE